MTQQLILMGGLPGSGKSTVADGISRALGCPMLSVDPLDAAMKRAGIDDALTGRAAYGVAEAAADEQLRLGHSVIIDAVNPVEPARLMWRMLAAKHGVPMRVVVCLCRDVDLHRVRVEARVRNIAGFPELTWDRVVRRMANHDPWTDEHLLLETDAATPDELIARAVAYLRS